jgi:hypothetical protein
MLRHGTGRSGTIDDRFLLKPESTRRNVPEWANARRP